MRYGQIDKDYAIRLATTPPDDDGPIWMVNLMRYRERADYADGRQTTLTGREADDLYAPIGPLTAIGAEPVFVGDVDTQFLNDTPKWDRVGIVKYPSRRAFIEMQQRPDFQALHEHKDAGMAETIVIGCLPMPVPELPADAPSWDDVPFPPTAEDGDGGARAEVQGAGERHGDGHLHGPRGEGGSSQRGAHRGVAAGRGHHPR